MAVETTEPPPTLRVLDGLANTMLERMVAAALIHRSDMLHAYADPDFGIDRLVDFHAIAVVTAIANLIERKAVIDIKAVEAELVQAGHANLGWYPALCKQSPDVIQPEWFRRSTSHLVFLAAKRNGAVNGHNVVEAEIDEFALRDVEATPIVKLKSLLVADVAKLETPPIRSYSTGNYQLDTLMGGGINTRELAIVMGPPAAGKTAWAVATSIAIQKTLPVLYASTELEQHELMARIAANLMERSWAAIRRGVIDRNQVIAFLDGVQIRLIGCDVLPRAGDAALALIEEEARKLAKLCGVPPLIVIDYLQDLARGSERDVRGRVGDYASALRAMSQRLDCPLIGVSSVSRTFYSAKKAAEFREYDDATVYLAAAKESGDVDYAAARVLFLDAEDDREKPERNVRIAVAKSRDARTGFAGARMVGESGRWYADPGVVDLMTSAKDESKQNEEDNETMMGRIRAELASGNLCTTRDLRTGSGISKERAEAALTRLRLARRVGTEEHKRVEGGKRQTRTVWVIPEGQS